MGKSWQKIKTTIYALFAPETMVTLAMRQHICARRIARHYSARQWTKAHGFFVQMGGFIYDDGKDYHVITIGPPGDVRLGDYTIDDPQRAITLPEITEEEIQDKGKGNIISTAVVVMQATWFVGNCIARSAQGLAITRLELVTLAFVAVNTITYLLWWDKPLDAQCPIYFKDGGVRFQNSSKKCVDTRASKEFQRSGQREGGGSQRALEF
ncbi:hypothetical protein AX16_008370 [Volvariella volvacea WC 439]|nr:hypothetical protein AX16_008370 [Volvariella volvacea WC 439]